MTVKTRLKQLAKLAGFKNATALAKAAGISEGAMRQHIARDSVPYDRAQEYVGACPGTGATADWLMSGKGAPPVEARSPMADIFNLDRFAKQPIATAAQQEIAYKKVTGDLSDGRETKSAGNSLPVYGATDLGGGIVSMTGDPDFEIERPEWSKSANDFSFFVQTDVMGPHPGRGDRVEVNWIEPPVEGDLVVLISGEKGKEWKCALRELVSFTDKQWKVKTYRPEKTETYDKDTWHTAKKVSGIQKR